MRAFIALPTSSEIKKELIKIQAEIIRLNPRLPVKWTEEFNMHVTLEFLGEIDEARAEKIKNILRALAPRHAVFEYRLGGLRAFPDWRAPRVLAVELGEGDAPTPLQFPPRAGGMGAALQNELRRELRRAGFAVDSRPWAPHLTLGRIKSNWASVKREGIQIRTASWPVDKLEFIKSELTPKGSRYTALGIFELSAKS